MKLLIAFLLSTVATAALAAPANYTEAKASADQDEASLGEAAAKLVESQANVLGPVLATCGAGDNAKDLSRFVVVMQLDATGKIVKTWRQGVSPIAVCFEKGVKGKQLIAPPKAPFYTSFDMQFTN